MLIAEKMEKGNFSESEQTIIRFITEKKLLIKDMTTKDIAQATYTSPSTLVRIAHKMGFSGWNELKDAFLKEEEYLQSHFCDIDANFPFNKTDNIMTIASKIATLEKESIEDTLSLISHDDLQKALHILDQASTIHLYGVSNNTYITQEFRHNMSRIHKHVELCSTQGELVYSAFCAEPDSCGLIVSYSGETPILKRVALALKAQNIPVIAITNIGDNTVSRLADVVLRICTREKLYSKIATFSTDSSITYLLDVLFSCIYAMHYDRYTNKKIQMSRMIEQGRYSTVDIMRENDTNNE